MTAGQLCETFGFTKEKQWTPVGDLSGGERRRLQLLRLLMDEPNVLFLDEPTNDLDIETLTQLEDLLDGWPGSMVVICHDRYFVERTTDRVFALLGDGSAADAAARHRRVPGAPPRDGGGARPPAAPPRRGRAERPRRPTPAPRRRNCRSIERQLDKVAEQGEEAARADRRERHGLREGRRTRRGTAGVGGTSARNWRCAGWNSPRTS